MLTVAFQVNRADAKFRVQSSIDKAPDKLYFYLGRKSKLVADSQALFY